MNWTPTTRCQKKSMEWSHIVGLISVDSSKHQSKQIWSWQQKKGKVKKEKIMDIRWDQWISNDRSIMTVYEMIFVPSMPSKNSKHIWTKVKPSDHNELVQLQSSDKCSSIIQYVLFASIRCCFLARLYRRYIHINLLSILFSLILCLFVSLSTQFGKYYEIDDSNVLLEWLNKIRKNLYK